MAGHTTHYNLIKPTSAERVAVGDINDNSDIIDGNLFTANERADQMADDYNASETYNTGDYVRRENYLYKCNTDNTTGTWDDTKWDRVKVMGEISQGGGGGSSTLAGLNDVDLSSPTDGQLLAYNATTGKWENVTGGGGGGSTTFAGLNDVNVQGVQNGDIARYNSTTGKWTDSSDLTDLELSVSQLSSSVLSIAGDVDTLELTVNQMSASTLPYDANISTKQKIDNVESSIPTSASDLPYSSSQSTKQKIDEMPDWDAEETFINETGLLVRGRANPRLKLACIYVTGSSSVPSTASHNFYVTPKYTPSVSFFARGQDNLRLYVTGTNNIHVDGTDKSWATGYVMYPTA